MTPDQKLSTVYNLVSDHLASGRDILLSTYKVLQKILDITEEKLDMDDTTVELPALEQEAIIISCDASITENPGGQASVGVVIRNPDGTLLTKFAKLTPAKTNNEGEYDAIYEALTYIGTIAITDKYPIIVRSDSQLVVKQLQGDYKINHEGLQKRHDAIHELAAALPVEVAIEWHPRNSTPDLIEANNSAQIAIGVKVH